MPTNQLVGSMRVMGAALAAGRAADCGPVAGGLAWASAGSKHAATVAIRNERKKDME